jgi:hypothetical protein
MPSGGCSRPYGDLRVRCLFDAIGAPQAWAVPAGVSFVVVDAWGAAGAAPAVESGAAGVMGGRGAGVSVTADVHGGELLTIDVGRRGHPTGRAPSDDGLAEREVSGGAGGDTTVSDDSGRWLLAGGGAGASAGAEGRGWFGVSGAHGTTSIRGDREVFGVTVHPGGTVGDGRVRLVYDQFDADGPPSVVVRRVGGHVDPRGRRALHFRVVFDQPVTGFTGSDVLLGGTARGALRAAVRAVAPFDGTHYDVAVVGMASAGTVTASVPAGVATDHQFSRNTASTS